MADLKQLFHILKDDAGGGGEAPISRIEGEASAAKEGLIGFSFKDSSGNVVLPQLNAAGEIPVSNEANDLACLTEQGKATGSLSDVDIALITLSASTVYRRISYIVTCLRASEFRIESVDDKGSGDITTILAQILVGPGDYTDSSELFHLEFTSGSTGVQSLDLVAKNLFDASDLRGTLAVGEVQ